MSTSKTGFGASTSGGRGVTSLRGSPHSKPSAWGINKVDTLRGSLSKGSGLGRGSDSRVSWNRASASTQITLVKGRYNNDARAQEDRDKKRDSGISIDDNIRHLSTHGQRPTSQIRSRWNHCWETSKSNAVKVGVTAAIAGVVGFSAGYGRSSGNCDDQVGRSTWGVTKQAAGGVPAYPGSSTSSGKDADIDCSWKTFKQCQHKYGTDRSAFPSK